MPAMGTRTPKNPTLLALLFSAVAENNAKAEAVAEVKVLRPTQEPIQSNEGEQKQCTGCNLFLPLGQFHRGRTTNHGLQNKCKPCAKLYYQQNKEQMKEEKRRRSTQLRRGLCTRCRKRALPKLQKCANCNAQQNAHKRFYIDQEEYKHRESFLGNSIQTIE
jgi:hypothetical protein